MRLPWDSLIPLEAFRLTIADSSLVISSTEPGVTDTCAAIMEAMLELYNLTDKVARHRATSPWSLFAAYPGLLPDLIGSMIGGAANLYQTLINSRRINELYLESFLHTRVFGYRDGTDIQNLQVLMPVLDAMNHDHRGAAYALRDDGDRGPQLTIGRCSPVPEKDEECFACYGPYDCFEMWLGYGFVDENWREISYLDSQPMTIDIPGLRKIHVIKPLRPRDPHALPPSMRDLVAFVPRILARRPDHVTISALLVPGPQRPRALRRSLHYLINDISPEHRYLFDLIVEAERQVLAANTLYYQTLVDRLRTIKPQDLGLQQIVRQFVRVCDVQLARLRDYGDYARN